MEKASIEIKPWQKIVIALILLFAIVLRLAVYLQNRSLFLDEANVSLNMVESSFGDFFRPFENEQQVPPLLSILIKTCISIFGINEYALRLIPLLASIAGVFVFYQLQKQYIKHQWSQWLILWVFACSYSLLQYASEVKQYGVDVLISSLLLLAASKTDFSKASQSTLLKWGIGGVIVVWISMSSIFILAGIGCYALWQCRDKMQQQPSQITPFLLLGFGWLLSFGIYFWAILFDGIQSEAQQTFHSEYFLPFIPTDAVSAQQWLSIQGEIFRTTIGKTGIALGFGICMWFLGILKISKEKKELIFLLLFPFLATWLASSLGKYSLLPRLALFYMPISLLLIGMGIDTVLERLKGHWKYILIPILIVVASHQWGYRHLWQKMENYDIKTVLVQLSNKCQKDDHLYLHFFAVPAYRFYTEYHQDKHELYSINYASRTQAKWNDTRPHFSSEPPQRLWILISHSMDEFLPGTMAIFEKDYKKEDEIYAKGAVAILMVRKE